MPVNPVNPNDQNRRRRSVLHKKLSFRNIINNGSPACQSLPVFPSYPSILENNLLLENSDKMLLENGNNILLEQ